jgi:hypothetical protein
MRHTTSKRFARGSAAALLLALAFAGHGVAQAGTDVTDPISVTSVCPSLVAVAGQFPSDMNPAPVVLHNGAIAVFGRGGDGAIWWIQQAGDHGPWESLTRIDGDFPIQ